MNNIQVETDLANTNLDLFQKIESQTSDADKRSLLALQSAVREQQGNYVYLEIGSYLGGSIQPHLLDPRCTQIFSIDNRPGLAADARGKVQSYNRVSTEDMLENLATVAPTQKITCFDTSVLEIEHSLIDTAPALCFVDGEHTDSAAWDDFEFCLAVMAESGVIVFHDAMIIYNSLFRVLDHLRRKEVPFRAYNLPDTIFVVEINGFPMHRHPKIAELLVDNHLGYLASLKFNDGYREFANRRFFRLYQEIETRFKTKFGR